jgi:hypothetical protein
MKHATIHSESVDFTETPVSLEALKILSNALFLNRDFVSLLLENGALENICSALNVPISPFVDSFVEVFTTQ